MEDNYCYVKNEFTHDFIHNLYLEAFLLSEHQSGFSKIKKLSDVLRLQNEPDSEIRLKRRIEYVGLVLICVNIRLEQDPTLPAPNPVFWDYAELPLSDGTVITNYNTVVSLDGTVIKKNDERTALTLFINNKKPDNLTVKEELKEIRTRGYKKIPIKIKDNDVRNFSIHRIVATTFIIMPEYLKWIPRNKLEVNHKNKFRDDNCYSNLEWLTITGNQWHKNGKKEYHVARYFLFEVIVDNGFKGREFVVEIDDSDIPKNLKSSFFKKRLAISNNNKGFYITEIPHTLVGHYGYGFPKDILRTYELNSDYFDPNVKTYLGRVLVGKYRGLDFIVVGNKDFREWFNLISIEQLSLPIAISKTGCEFKEISLRKCILNEEMGYLKMAQDILDDIDGYEKPIPGICGYVNVGKYKGYRFFITTKTELNKYFDHSLLFSDIDNQGYQLKHISHFHIPNNYPTMTDEIMEDIKKTLNEESFI